MGGYSWLAASKCDAHLQERLEVACGDLQASQSDFGVKEGYEANHL